METCFLAASPLVPAAKKRREVLPSAAREKKLLVPLVKRYSLFSNGHLAIETEDEENTGLNHKVIFLKLW